MGLKGKGGELLVCGFYEGGRGGRGVVDKLTLNSKTVVNTGRKKNILNVAHLVTKSCKKRKEKSVNKSVTHRGFSIQNCTFSALSNRVQDFFSLFSIVCDSETEKS